MWVYVKIYRHICIQRRTSLACIFAAIKIAACFAASNALSPGLAFTFA